MPNISVFDRLIESLRRSGEYHHNDSVAPAAILWPDEKREWEKLAPRLRKEIPDFLTLGRYDPVDRTGPALWIRCVIAGRVAETTISENSIPIIYMPGTGRSALRATEECPVELRALVETAYRGVFFAQSGGKDWTIASFLGSANRGGLGLKVARGKATAVSLRRSLIKLADASIEELRIISDQRELDCEDFDKYQVEDITGDLLDWIADRERVERIWDRDRLETFRSKCPLEYGFDPVKDGERAAAEKLGLRVSKAWENAWRRFADSPARYAGVVARLQEADPRSRSEQNEPIEPTGTWPSENEFDENKLRKELLDLARFSPADARARIHALEAEHGGRRDSPWAKLGRSPLTFALFHLDFVACATANPLSGHRLEELIVSYQERGARADLAVLEALAAVSSQADQASVHASIRAIYLPWLRDNAELFQDLLKKCANLPSIKAIDRDSIAPGACVLFVDALRYDAGLKLKEQLEKKNMDVTIESAFVAAPSVTATSKYAIAPIARLLGGIGDGADFLPSMAETGKVLTVERFRESLVSKGFTFLNPKEPMRPGSRCWTEIGRLDETGHHVGAGLARRIPELLDEVCERIEGLLEGGANEVHIVTDHGWLIMPGGLPKEELPNYLVETKWSRCAAVKSDSSVDLPISSWYWNRDILIASPRGAGSFRAGVEYSHGGLSLQECVAPRITVRRSAVDSRRAKIESVSWTGLRCRIKIVPSTDGLRVDMRDRIGDPNSSIAEPKKVSQQGEASIIVADHRSEGKAANLVLIGPDGKVIDKFATTIGG
jgi:hypothetical protein